MLEKLHTKLNEARKSGNKKELTILQVIIGEVATLKGRTGKLTEDDIEKTIRKVMAGNDETMFVMTRKYREENEYLKGLWDSLSEGLPKNLNISEIKDVLGSCLEEIRTAKSVGMATGIALKTLKGKDLKVRGEDVAKAVEELRE